eukprot:1062689-Prorocentrum_minimum.AAC.1
MSELGQVLHGEQDVLSRATGYPEQLAKQGVVERGAWGPSRCPSPSSGLSPSMGDVTVLVVMSSLC